MKSPSKTVSDRRRRVAGTLTASTAVAVLLASFATGATASANPEDDSAVASTTRVAPDIASARISARSSHHRVEALELRDERTQVFANPDGSFSRKIAASAIRVRDEDAKDGWRPIDLNLIKNADGSLSPGASPAKVRFSGGGTNSGSFLAQQKTTKGESLNFEWDGPLPAPTIRGSRATYSEVQPGIDLELQATPSGFEHYFIIKRRPSGNTQLTLSIPIDVSGLRIRAGKTSETVTHLETLSGEPVGTLSPAFTWDSSGAIESSSRDVSISHSRIVEEQGSKVIEIKPSAKFLNDPATTFPVVVDPQVYLEGGSMGTAYVQSDMPNSTNDTGSYLPVGTSSGVAYRSFVGFVLGEYNPGLSITSSTLYIRNDLSSSCTPTKFSTFGVVGTQTRPVDITWANQPAVDQNLRTDTYSSNGGGSQCTSDYVGVDTTPQLRSVVATQSAYFTLGLRASETDSAAFKLFDSMSHQYPPVLDVTYEQAPDNGEPNLKGIPLSAPLSLPDAVDLGANGSDEVVGYRYDNGQVVGEFYPGDVTVPDFISTFNGTYGTQPAVTDLVAVDDQSANDGSGFARAASASDSESERLETGAPAFVPAPVSQSKLDAYMNDSSSAGSNFAKSSSSDRSSTAAAAAAAAASNHASWSPDIVAVRVWRSGNHQYIRNNIAWDTTSNNNVPSNWGMEVGVDLLRTVDGASDSKYGKRGNVWPNKICELGFRDKFVAKNYKFNSWSATSTQGSVGAGKAYADYNDLSDSCYRNSMTIGFQKPGLIPGNRLVTEIDAQKGTTTTSFTGAGVQLVHDDCGSRPSAVALTDCMGVNPLFFNPPASYFTPRPVLNSARGWASGPNLCWRSSDYGTSTPVKIACP